MSRVLFICFGDRHIFWKVNPMIYGYYGHAFNPGHLVIMAVIAFIFGHSARCRSVLARRVGMPIGFAIAGLFICDGIIHSQYEPQVFVNNEFPRLLFLVWIVTNVSSAIAGWSEPLVEKHREHVNAMQVKRKEAQLQHERRIKEAEWERTRPEREAREREQTKIALERERERKAKEAQAAREKALAAAAAKVQAEIDANRRDQARRSVQLAFFAASPKVQQAISWDWLKEYISTYLSDTISADNVEENAKRIVRTIKSHANLGTRRNRKPRNVAEVIREFQQKKVEIENLPLTDDDRAALLSDLEMQKALEVENCK